MENEINNDAPKEQIKDITNVATSFPQEIADKPQKDNKKLLLIVVVCVLVLIIGLGLYVLNLYISKSKVLKNVGGESITQFDFDIRVKDTMIPGDIEKANNDEKLKEEILQELTREKAVEIEAKKRGITVSNEELDAATTAEEKQNPPAKSLHYRQLLEEKVKLAVVTNRKVNMMTSYKEPDLVNFAQLSKATTDSMNKVRESMTKNGSDMQKAYSEVRNSAGFDSLINFFEEKSLYSGTISEDIFTKILSLKKGEVSEVIYNDSGTFMMIEVLDAVDTPFPNFDAWLNSMNVSQ